MAVLSILMAAISFICLERSIFCNNQDLRTSEASGV